MPAHFRLKLGEIETFVPTNGSVYHMEIDLIDPTKLLFAEADALKTTDGITTEHLADFTSYGFAEGVGPAATFSFLTGFTQLNRSAILAADFSNSCLRIIDRVSLITTSIVGNCVKAGFQDGLNALFNSPLCVIKHLKSPDKVLVSDYENDAVRQVDMVTRITSTLITQSSGLMEPKSMTFDPLGENLLICNNVFIAQYNMASGRLKKTGESRGYRDGKLTVAQFYSPIGIVSLSKSVTLVTDNNRLRVINYGKNRVESICAGISESSDGPVNICQLNGSLSLLAENGTIYVGEHQSIRILSCKFCFNITHLKLVLTSAYSRELQY